MSESPPRPEPIETPEEPGSTEVPTDTADTDATEATVESPEGHPEGGEETQNETPPSPEEDEGLDPVEDYPNEAIVVGASTYEGARQELITRMNERASERQRQEAAAAAATAIWTNQPAKKHAAGGSSEKHHGGHGGHGGGLLGAIFPYLEMVWQMFVVEGFQAIVKGMKESKWGKIGGLGAGGKKKDNHGGDHGHGGGHAAAGHGH